MTARKPTKTAVDIKGDDPFVKMYKSVMMLSQDPAVGDNPGVEAVMYSNHNGKRKTANSRFENKIDGVLKRFEIIGINMIPAVDSDFAQGNSAADHRVFYLNPDHHKIVPIITEKSSIGFAIENKHGLVSKKFCPMTDDFAKPLSRDELNDKWPGLSKGTEIDLHLLTGSIDQDQHLDS